MGRGEERVGDILLDLDLRPGGVYSFASVSGDVALRVPAGDPSVAVDAVSVSGDLESDWDLAWERRRAGRRRVHATLGSGEAHLTMKTVSGDLRIARRQAAA